MAPARRSSQLLMTKYLASRCSLPWRQAICAIVFEIAVPLVGHRRCRRRRFSFSSRTTSPAQAAHSRICGTGWGSNWPSGPWNALLAAIRSAIIASEIASPRLDAWGIERGACRSCARTCSPTMDFACSAVICTPLAFAERPDFGGRAAILLAGDFLTAGRPAPARGGGRGTPSQSPRSKAIARRAIKDLRNPAPGGGTRAPIIGAWVSSKSAAGAKLQRGVPTRFASPCEPAFSWVRRCWGEAK